MTMEVARVRVVRKPWGRSDLRPWSELGHDGSAIGELWFERSLADAPEPALLLKLLFTDEPLSIQVHPDDAFARSLGLPTGKTEAWYILAAAKGARIALGLKHDLTPPQLRAAISDGSIADLVKWHDLAADESVLVPAGTIHAIGGGLVIAEIQQRGDTTFRMFDYGSRRELHIDGAVGSSLPSQSVKRTDPVILSESRRVMAQSPHFVLEEVELTPDSYFEIDALGEVWVLIIVGEVAFDLTRLQVGEAMFLHGHRAGLRTTEKGAKALIAYVANEPLLGLLRGRNGTSTDLSADHVPELGIGQPVAKGVRGPWGLAS
jgi:mannose-6-phosphate isomerase